MKGKCRYCRGEGLSPCTCEKPKSKPRFTKANVMKRLAKEILEPEYLTIPSAWAEFEARAKKLARMVLRG